MANYLYSVAIQVNSFENNMGDKMVGGLTWSVLMNIHRTNSMPKEDSTFIHIIFGKIAEEISSKVLNDRHKHDLYLLSHVYCNDIHRILIIFIVF